MSRFVQFVGWGDVPHLSEENKRGLESIYLPHERAARTRGIPSLGAGAIYPVAEEDIVVEPFELPVYWRHAYGMDVGWNRTAAIWGALNPETDVLYLYHEHYQGEEKPPIHAAAIKAPGSWIPGVIDPASRGRGQDDGEQLLRIYHELGLVLSIADNSVTAGIYDVWTRLSTGRLKVFKTLQYWLEEYRIYRRDEKGGIVKAKDHLMDSTRYLVRSGIQIAAQRPPDDWRGRPGMPGQMGGKHQSDYDPMAAMMPQHKQQTGRPSQDEGWIPFKGMT